MMDPKQVRQELKRLKLAAGSPRVSNNARPGTNPNGKLFFHSYSVCSARNPRERVKDSRPAQKNQHQRAWIQIEDAGAGAKGFSLKQKMGLARSCV